jgi:hypothetical protein
MTSVKTPSAQGFPVSAGQNARSDFLYKPNAGLLLRFWLARPYPAPPFSLCYSLINLALEGQPATALLDNIPNYAYIPAWEYIIYAQ